jgi:predicted nucleotidyltransferase
MENDPPATSTVVNDELRRLVRTLANWIEPAPSIPAVYLFGSRVRGDHRPNSDVDIRVFFSEWGGVIDVRDMNWWQNQNATDFVELKRLLPGPLALHCDSSDNADTAILAGRKSPVFVCRRVVCVFTPPKR